MKLKYLKFKLDDCLLTCRTFCDKTENVDVLKYKDYSNDITLCLIMLTFC
jgi:hypothetical protein